jgi:hypothetical protein
MREERLTIVAAVVLVGVGGGEIGRLLGEIRNLIEPNERPDQRRIAATDSEKKTSASRRFAPAISLDP